jgi:hypothetical protein
MNKRKIDITSQQERTLAETAVSHSELVDNNTPLGTTK